MNVLASLPVGTSPNNIKVYRCSVFALLVRETLGLSVPQQTTRNSLQRCVRVQIATRFPSSRSLSHEGRHPGEDIRLTLFVKSTAQMVLRCTPSPQTQSTRTPHTPPARASRCSTRRRCSPGTQGLSGGPRCKARDGRARTRHLPTSARRAAFIGAARASAQTVEGDVASTGSNSIILKFWRGTRRSNAHFDLPPAHVSPVPLLACCVRVFCARESDKRKAARAAVRVARKVGVGDLAGRLHSRRDVIGRHGPREVPNVKPAPLLVLGAAAHWSSHQSRGQPRGRHGEQSRHRKRGWRHGACAGAAWPGGRAA
mmetsp:Transcript_58799/g.134875  ORF Transcript_58799/g.134875 Transcript_58799/m.134875 type:complete len:313 (+) Transcript_58799:267-1205(+)